LSSTDFAERERHSIGTIMQLRYYDIVVDRARGCEVWDVDGRRYLDLVSQWGVTNIGAGHPDVVEAIKRQVDKLIVSAHVTFPSVPAIELAEKLIDITPGHFGKKVWFGLSGSDANEFVYKMLPIWNGRRRFLSFYGSYHGTHMGAVTLSGHMGLNKHMGFGNSIKIPYPYPYRCSFCKDSKCTMACFDFGVENIVSHYQTEDISAAIVEPVESDGGDIVPPPEFIPRLYKFCKENGVMFVDDEVKVGFGRTGKMFAVEHSEVHPDLITMAKPLASGMPLSAVVGRTDVMDADVSSHVVTLGGHPVSCAAGLATISVIERDGLARRAGRTGSSMLERMKEIADGHSLIGEARGLGLIMGLELVKNQRTKEPASFEALSVAYRAWKLGGLVGVMGERGNVLEIMPPLNITKQEAEEGASIIEKAIDDVEKGRVDKASVKKFASPNRSKKRAR
jgi:4-aminobutyrate aminotransferase